MNSTERVKNTIIGKKTDRTPIYGWVSANMSDEITKSFGSVAAFEDKYEFDVAHIFGGPSSFNMHEYNKVLESGIELTPDILLEIPLNSPDNHADYDSIVNDLKHHKTNGRERFCYLQTPGFFEHYNSVFGIENHLMYMAMYEDELIEIYKRQAEWTKSFALNALELGIDMIHLSDDWGAQNSLLFSPDMWRKMIFPNLCEVSKTVKNKSAFFSLHSDGYIMPLLDGIAEAGFDIVHPFQESAGMNYNTYLDKYSDKFGILGGLCIQTTLGFGNYQKLESEIRRVFSLLKNKRWIFCTTHFTQNHCSVEELVFAYDLIYKLAREH